MIRIIKIFKKKIWNLLKNTCKFFNITIIHSSAGNLYIGGILPVSDFRKYYPIMGFKNVGIVIQGPIDRNRNFTFNTIKQLRHIYPDIKIVLSTWKGDLTHKEIIWLNKLECYILENISLPTEDKGAGRKEGHLNNQLFSSIKGIRHLKSLGVEYVLKMRTDTRIYKNDFIPYFLNQLSVFPCKKSIQKKRLINVAYSNNLASVPFFMSDFIWFGYVDDMERLYSIPTRDEKSLNMLKNLSYDKLTDNISKSFNNAHLFIINPKEQELWSENERYIYFSYREEAYIIHTYAVQFNLCEDSSYPLKDYYDFLRDYALVIDETEIMAYFDKYEYSANSAFYSSGFAQLTHSIWLDLMLHYNQEPE